MKINKEQKRGVENNCKFSYLHAELFSAVITLASCFLYTLYASAVMERLVIVSKSKKAFFYVNPDLFKIYKFMSNIFLKLRFVLQDNM